MFVFALETTESQLGAVLSQQALRAWRRVTTRAPLGAAQARRRVRQGLDLQVHRALGRKGQHLTHEVGISTLQARSSLAAR